MDAFFKCFYFSGWFYLWRVMFMYTSVGKGLAMAEYAANSEAIMQKSPLPPLPLTHAIPIIFAHRGFWAGSTEHVHTIIACNFNNRFLQHTVLQYKGCKARPFITFCPYTGDIFAKNQKTNIFLKKLFTRWLQFNIHVNIFSLQKISVISVVSLSICFKGTFRFFLSLSVINGGR